MILPAPAPELPWYQFSLRSLCVLTLLVAVFCSIGASTHWGVPVVVLIGGGVGGIFARTWLGLAQGAVSGSICSIAASVVFGPLIIVVIISSLLGGLLGGYSAKYHSEG